MSSAASRLTKSRRSALHLIPAVARLPAEGLLSGLSARPRYDRLWGALPTQHSRKHCVTNLAQTQRLSGEAADTESGSWEG